jgi:hypothetical protein
VSLVGLEESLLLGTDLLYVQLVEPRLLELADLAR